MEHVCCLKGTINVKRDEGCRDKENEQRGRLCRGGRHWAVSGMGAGLGYEIAQAPPAFRSHNGHH